MAARRTSAATGKDKARRGGPSGGKSRQHDDQRPSVVPRFFRGAKSPWLRRGPKPRGGTLLWRMAPRTLCRTGPPCRQHASRLDFGGGRSSIVRLQNGDDDSPDCRDNRRSDCPRLGLVASIARPGGNITGVAVAAGLEIIGKRMGLLVEAMPKLSTVGYLASRPYWEDDPRGAVTREAAKQAGISLKAALLGNAFNEAEYQRVFRSMEQDRADALMVSDEPEHVTYRATIVELAAKGRIPTIYQFREFVEIGGLMAYSIDQADAYRRLANLIDKILRGANPGDIPFYQPTKFELSINLKTAKALGLEMPAMLLGRADEVIE